MPAIAQADVTVTVNPGDRDIAGPGSFKNMTMAQVAFGNGTLTYPTGGIPLPDIGKFGFNKGVDGGFVIPPLDGFMYKYDKANHKLLLYTQGVSTGATAIAAAETGALVKNSAGVEATAPRLPKTAISTTYDMGAMIELPATIAPVATVLQMMLVGQ